MTYQDKKMQILKKFRDDDTIAYANLDYVRGQEVFDEASQAIDELLETEKQEAYRQGGVDELSRLRDYVLFGSIIKGYHVDNYEDRIKALTTKADKGEK